MRKSIVFVLVASAALAETASAKTRPMVSRPIAVHVLSACSNAGGQYYSNAGGYGCSVKNCDGKGGECRVDCKNGGKCEGTTPSRIAANLDIMNVLTNGGYAKTGGRPKGAPGSILDGAGGFAAQGPLGAGAPMTPPKPSAPPPPQIR